MLSFMLLQLYSYSGMNFNHLRENICMVSELFVYMIMK